VIWWVIIVEARLKRQEIVDSVKLLGRLEEEGSPKTHLGRDGGCWQVEVRDSLPMVMAVQVSSKLIDLW